MSRFLSFALLVLISLPGFSQQPLTVEKIMQDPKWIGTSPNNLIWSPDSRTIYFTWNPVKALNDSLYKATLQNPQPSKVDKTQRMKLPSFEGQFNQAWMAFNRARTKAVFEKYG